FMETSKITDKILELIIDEHEKKRLLEMSITIATKNSFDVIRLSLKDKPANTYYVMSMVMDRPDIKTIILNTIFGSVKTSQGVVEWIVSELIRHSRVTKRLQEELKTAVGVTEKVEKAVASRPFLGPAWSQLDTCTIQLLM
ncbi:hypothetical protein RJ639_026098, partial [Escallonia herrerae]